MSYTREIRKKIAQIEAKQAEIEALENDVRMAAFKHVVSLINSDAIGLEEGLEEPHYIYLYKWRGITITLKNGKKKRLRAHFFRVFLDDKKPIVIVDDAQIDIFKIKKIEIC